MSSPDDLVSVIQAAMEENGSLGKISAEIRAEVFKLLMKDAEKPQSIPLCRENMIINELIREYLEFQGFKNTVSVFVPETGLPTDPLNKEFLAHTMKVIPKKSEPLIFTVIDKKKNEGEAQMIDDIKNDRYQPPPLFPDSESVEYAEPNSESDGFFEIPSQY